MVGTHWQRVTESVITHAIAMAVRGRKMLLPGVILESMEFDNSTRERRGEEE